MLVRGFRTGAAVHRAQGQGQRHHYQGDQAQHKKYVDIGQDGDLALHHLIDDGRVAHMITSDVIGGDDPIA